MSEKEFELYLTLLSRFLKLSPEQCAAISDELRDHLEERFDELSRAGLSREDAIRRALEEFGDATHLASHFSELSKQRRRRFVMRCTLASILVGAIAIFTIPAFLPRNAVIDIPARAIAQQKSETARDKTQTSDKKTPVSTTTRELKAADAELPQPLREKITLELTDTPLADICQTIQERCGMQVMLDEVDLKEEDIDPEIPINVDVENIPIHVALSWILHPLGLEWRVQDGLLHITTIVADEDPDKYTSKTYNVRELLRGGFEQVTLLDTILEVTHGPWEEIDGDGGTMDLVGDLISVRYGYHQHREIAALLDAFHKHTDTTATKFDKQTTVLGHSSNVKMRDRLQDSVTVDFTDTPLSEVVKFFNENHSVRMRLDQHELEDAGIDGDTAITFSMYDKSLATTLKYLLKPLGCVAVVRDGGIWITTIAEVEQDGDFWTLVVYDIRDLVTPRLQNLVDAIYNETRGPWTEIDGDGGVIGQPVAWLLVIRTIDNVHAEIRQYLANLRAATPDEPRPDFRQVARAKESEVVTKYYRMEDGTAEDLLKAIPELIDPFSWAVDGESVGRHRRDGTIRKVVTGRREVKLPANAILELPQSPMNTASQELTNKEISSQFQQTRGGTAITAKSPGVLVVPEAVLIIRHTNRTHRKIASLLKELRIDR